MFSEAKQPLFQIYIRISLFATKYHPISRGANTSFTGCGARQSLIEDEASKLPHHEIHASAPQSGGN
jgi:hypothetical protein